MQPQIHYVSMLRARGASLLAAWLLLLAIMLTVDISDATAQPTEHSDRPRLGLVLSGGGARGLAHVGTLKMLDSLQIEVDCIAGTSMGGIIGAFYAMGYSGAEIEKQLLQIEWRDLFHDDPPRATLPFFRKRETGRYQISLGFTGFKPSPPSGLIFGQNISLTFARYTFPFESVRDFDRLPIPFRCVAIDLITGRQVVLGHGSLARAMRASMAIPTVFSPVAW
ncbi:MAG: patatin-like phospholipase family protein, partial [bacterium]